MGGTTLRGVKAQLLGPDSTAWAAVLAEARHDFYHLPRYVAASAPNDGGEPRALIIEARGRRLLLPVVVRAIPGDRHDACSPYGYPGPIQTGTPDAEFERDALLAGIEFLRAEGMVSLFIRTHPLLNPTPPQGVGVLVRHGDTVAVDLTLSGHELWRQTRRNHRQQIRQALDKGYAVEIDPDWRHIREFKAMYRSTMDDCSADVYYYFDDAYFEALRQALGSRVHLAIAHRDSVVAAAGMFVVTGGIAEMHLTGHDARFTADQPMKLLFHHVRTWCCEQGIDVLHLGGGRGGIEDSLFHFKAGFSRLRQPYHTVRVVIDEVAYARLAATRGGVGDPSDPLQPFPAYRAG